jgi:hypothetical protein
MTAKVFSFAAAKQVTKKKPPVVAEQNRTSIFVSVCSEMLQGWQEHASKNKLGEFVRRKIPVHARGLETADFLSDLNVIAVAESKLNIILSTLSPGNSSSPACWVIGFTLDNQVYSAPAVMGSEAYARAFNLIVFAEFTSQVKKLKL